MPDDDLLQRLRRFHDHAFPRQEQRFRQLVDQGQHPATLFIGCSDSRLVPYLLTGTGPGELFLVRNVAAFVPPYDGYMDAPCGAASAPGRAPLGAAPRWVGYHGTSAAIEFAVLNLQVRRIVVCGHSHCGGIRALYGGVPAAARNLAAWLELGREATLPVAEPGPEALRRTEQRAVVLQLERLMDYPMVRERVEAGALTLHGWHYVIEEGQVHVFDVANGRFLPASEAGHAGTGPYVPHAEPRREAPG
ncbi:carbonic anhydrase [Pseudorhodoferax sp.]|uniref:carbonic anhydrase n=1 Tax=Pseudorhodoferax sp. TaxID=1993553 RepID=UPI0039E62ACD